MSTRPHALELIHVTKCMQEKVILDHVTFQVPQGEVCLLVGPNGTGKSVTLRCILGFEAIESGTIKILGCENSSRIYIRKKTGLVSSDHLEFLQLLTPNEYFQFIIEMYKIPQQAAQAMIADLSTQLSIDQHLNTLVQNLSFGTKKKVQLLATLLYDPDLLICDEIFEGLDTASVEVVKQLFVNRSENGKTVFFTSHIEEVADQIATMKFTLINGQITRKAG